MRNFRKYDIYSDALNIATLVYGITKSFPKIEQFALTNQINRAVVSIASNIAEGSSRESEKDFAHFLEISLGSAYEVETQLLIAKNLGYVTDESIKSVIGRIEKLERQINQLICKIRPIANS